MITPLRSPCNLNNAVKVFPVIKTAIPSFMGIDPKNLPLTLERFIMKNLKTLLIIATLAAVTAHAQTNTKIDSPMALDSKAIRGTSSADMTGAEVRKIDMDTKKITLKHGEIKNLDMPGMTMVFQVKDPAMLDKVKAGDKVLFKAEKLNGAIVVTDLQPSK